MADLWAVRDAKQLDVELEHWQVLNCDLDDGVSGRAFSITFECQDKLRLDSTLGDSDGAQVAVLVRVILTIFWSEDIDTAALDV